MAKKAKIARDSIIMHNKESGYQYITEKNFRNTTEKLTLKKYDPVLKKRATFKERSKK